MALATVQRAHEFLSCCCSRERFTSCKEKAVRVAKICAPLFIRGAISSLLCQGAYNAILVGFPVLVKNALSTSKTKVLEDTDNQLFTATVAVTLGVCELGIWALGTDRMNRQDPDREESDFFIEAFGASVASVGSLYPAISLAQWVQNQIQWQKRLTGVFFQTVFGMTFSGVANIPAVLLLKGARHVWIRLSQNL